MKKVKFLLLFIWFFTICSAQKDLIVQGVKKDLVKSIPFPFQLMGDKCESYIIKSENGRIEQINEDCKFLFYPEEIGLAKITVYDKSGKIITEEFYKVKDAEFAIKISGANNYIDNVEYFLKTSRLDLYSDNLICLNFEWSCQFDFIYINDFQKESSEIISKNGNLKSLMESIESLNQNDILILKNFKIFIGDEEFYAPDIVLEVK